MVANKEQMRWNSDGDDDDDRLTSEKCQQMHRIFFYRGKYKLFFPLDLVQAFTLAQSN